MTREDLVVVVMRLVSEVDDLRKRVAALEGKPEQPVDVLLESHQAFVAQAREAKR